MLRGAATCLYVAIGWCCIVGRETEGVSCYDRTDATAETAERTDTGNRASRTAQSTQPTTHEKADMAVVSATYPGENHAENVYI